MTHIDGASYRKGVEDTEIKYREQLAALQDIKAEYDRAFVMCREAGVTRERTKRLSVAVYILINRKEDINITTDTSVKLAVATIKKATGQHINEHLQK